MTHSSIPNESSAAEKRMHPFDITYDKRRCGYFVVGHGFDFFLYFTGSPYVEEIYLECDVVMPEGVPGSYSHHLQFHLWNGHHSVQLVETMVYRELVKFFPEQF